MSVIVRSTHAVLVEQLKRIGNPDAIALFFSYLESLKSYLNHDQFRWNLALDLQEPDTLLASLRNYPILKISNQQGHLQWSILVDRSLHQYLEPSTPADPHYVYPGKDCYWLTLADWQKATTEAHREQWQTLANAFYKPDLAIPGAYPSNILLGLMLDNPDYRQGVLAEIKLPQPEPHAIYLMTTATIPPVKPGDLLLRVQENCLVSVSLVISPNLSASTLMAGAFHRGLTPMPIQYPAHTPEAQIIPEPLLKTWDEQYQQLTGQTLPLIVWQPAPLKIDTRPLAERMTALANKLLFPTPYLEKLWLLLQEKRQLIFYGPPGTGKTYVARELARTIAGTPTAVRLLQFHPSYAYEDFVQGYRPHAASAGQVQLELVNGPLLEIADFASKNSQQPCFLIIDEINRGNMARIFGELYFLLEYRGESLQLQYSQTPFALPPNLYLIGTMNTADRSIAMLDAALRRRFWFVPLMTDEPPINTLLAQYLESQNRPDLAWLPQVIQKANAKLPSRHLAIGPSHFLRPDLDESTIQRIWEYAIIPYLQEFFLDRESELKGFELNSLRDSN